jgi:cell division protein FtsZ
VVATGIDVAISADDIPVPRRRLKEPLAQTVSLERSEPLVLGTDDESHEAEVAADNNSEDADAFKTNLFDVEPEFEDVETDDLPAPAYQPAAQADDPSDDFFQIDEEDDRDTFIAPQSRQGGQPSAETMARLQAAMLKTTPKAQAQQPAARQQQAEKPRGFGLNSLISKMTGQHDDGRGSNRNHAQQPNLMAVQEEQVFEEPAMTEDQERIEIPAFLRRQAN